ncbi:hypothetical protein SGR_642 [Streptomyces griseus subsp. griseus NBRC 13350]|uniref:Uncharacterized protein n=1 Tax=Streptomyces griseus subsp. griseus (strain JCM 4626 / CBS 651.72 / NBRC 13350 / KCC S-0626 / ISP 5235) TaxID=455632 RepID=B1VRQ3_STRGG|nr:hypothetical protein SGR_642 [Streptomyces griseus subsp. griseus NBRC 13350]
MRRHPGLLQPVQLVHHGHRNSNTNRARKTGRREEVSVGLVVPAALYRLPARRDTQHILEETVYVLAPPHER